MRGHTQPVMQRGFTIVELLIVIIVIAVLAAITIVAYNNVQQRSRDSRRSADMAQIKKNLLLYQADNGGVPKPATYGSSGLGGWDNSGLSTWLSFLRAQYGDAPIDPVNTATTDPTFPGNLQYYYFCYNAGSGPLPATPNVRIGYHTEQTGAAVNVNFAVEKCL